MLDVYTVYLSDMADTELINAYVRKQLAVSDARTKNAIIDRVSKQKFHRRSAILKLERLLKNFQAGQDPRWIAILGLRGVGKTTMISQLFQSIQCPPEHKIFVSIDSAKSDLEIGVKEIINAYEGILGKPLETLDHPIYIFLDEIHFDPNWALSLKTLTDRSDYIFIVTTGSSVSEIRRVLDSDTARRILPETLHPMSFTEYILLRDNRRPIAGLGQKIRDALYQSEDVDSLYNALSVLQDDVKRYWQSNNLKQNDIDKYIKYANLPFTLSYDDNETYIYQQIDQIVTTIVNKDITAFGNFDGPTIRKVRPILYGLAGSSIVSMSALSREYEIDRTVLTALFDALEKASVIQRIYPHAQHMAQTAKPSTKPSKYLFVSSAYRSMYFNFVGSVTSYDDYKGFLLEDIASLYLSILTRQGVTTMTGLSVTYDASDNGADFIVASDHTKICIEVGYGNKKPSQANASKIRYACKYGITVSSSPLKKSSNSVTLPLSYFLLTA